MSNQLFELTGVSDEKAAQLIDTFQKFYDLANEWDKKSKELTVTSETQLSKMAEAKDGYFVVKEFVATIESLRKELKEESLREGQAIDKTSRELKGLYEPIMKYLEKQWKYSEYKEAERLQALRDARVPVLIGLGYQLSAGDPANYSEEEYRQLIDSLKAIRASREEAERVEQERLERERRALEAKREAEQKELAELRAKQEEAERIDREFRAEQDRIRRENERARAELERKLAEAKEENDRLEAEREDYLSKKTEADNLGLIPGDLLEAEKIKASLPTAEQRREALEMLNDVFGTRVQAFAISPSQTIQPTTDEEDMEEAEPRHFVKISTRDILVELAGRGSIYQVFYSDELCWSSPSNLTKQEVEGIMEDGGVSHIRISIEL